MHSAAGLSASPETWGPRFFTLVSLLLFLAESCEGSKQANATSSTTQCQDGLLIPLWSPAENLTLTDRVIRGLVYFGGLCYLFVGVSVIADRFMAAIEVITSKEKEITVRKANGDKQVIVVRVWNETVANLTLMALGSSAPEILLSIIEIYAKNFEAGELGPGTIVGSAAFNLFMIIGLCVYVIPQGEVRKIKHLRVFFVTATWSVFAYIWLYIILEVSSYGVVEVWEGILTFLFFPLTVLTAYIAERRLLIYRYLSKQYRMNKRGVIVETEGDSELGPKHGTELAEVELQVFDEEDNDEVREFEQHRREFIGLLRELRKKNPNLDMKSLETLAKEQLLLSGPKSRAYYRIQATRKLTGGPNLVKKAMDRTQSSLAEGTEGLVAVITGPDDRTTTRVFFDPGHYTVMENVGEFTATVRREGGDLNKVVLVDYQTEDGTASAGTDYMAASGTLTFEPGEVEKSFSVTVIDDDVFEEDEHFYMRLSNARLGRPVTASQSNGDVQPSPAGSGVELVSPLLATVMILDDDHCGVFNLAEKDVELVESVGTYGLSVTRWSGARGRVAVPYRTIEGTAKANKDYEDSVGEIIFENNETEKILPIRIIEEDSYEKDVIFYVELGSPRFLGNSSENVRNVEEISSSGLPRLGDVVRTQIRIKESKEFKNVIDKLLQRANASLVIGTSSWKEQFTEAVTVSSGEEDENGDEKKPSCSDYLLHSLTLFWKLLFAFVPPPSFYDGYLCFVVSISIIGFLTAIIGDLSSHLGCSIGLKDSVTAIAFVALGTSLPDMFASKVAAVQDKYADASVGNVTGSNAVNVFLGIGIAWSIAAVYHAIHGQTFHVSPGNLAFSVTLFCSTALLALLVMMLRRVKAVGGELGGPSKFKIPTILLFVFLWLFYVAMSSLEAYGYIPGL